VPLQKGPAKCASLCELAAPAFAIGAVAFTRIRRSPVVGSRKVPTPHQLGRFTVITFGDRGSWHQIYRRIKSLERGCRRELRIIAGRGTWAQGSLVRIQSPRPLFEFIGHI
jgi:hypothetical protein